VLVPILGDHYGRVLEAGELRLVREGGGLLVRYHEHELPISPRTLDGLLEGAARRASSAGGELAELARAAAALPPASLHDADARVLAVRRREARLPPLL